MLRLFAPFLPFVTEEVWSWWREGSVHKAAWPTAEEVLASCGHVEDRSGMEALRFASDVLGAIRKKKSEEQRPLKTPVAVAVIRAPAALLALLPAVEADLRASGLIQRLETGDAETLQVDVALAPAEPIVQERNP
jgi:valyl-tRNA synthetase